LVHGEFAAALKDYRDNPVLMKPLIKGAIILLFC
jgi:hypothetical protein